MLYILKYMFKPTVMAPVALCFIMGLFLLSQISLPGDALHPVKKITETTHETIVKQEDKSEFYLALAGKRANELKEIVDTNQVKKLSPAIKEYQASLVKVTESLIDAMTKDIEPEQAVVIVQKTAELKQITEEMEQSLGADIGVGEMEGLEETTMACLRQGFETVDNRMAVVIAQQIQDYESRSLTEEQEKIFEEVKQFYEDKNYVGAFMKIRDLLQM